jgi:outer membrane lipoprotein-sorting protein
MNMMYARKTWICALWAALLFTGPSLIGQTGPGAQDILARVDANEVYKTITYEGKMIIQWQGKTFTKTFTAAARTNSDSFIEFTNREDAGTRYLKKDGRLYAYSPDTEQVMLISGHMLKESMMGSDLSYEDTIENDTLSARYVPRIAASETIDGREAWVLELKAVKKTESYPTRKLWVAKDNYDVLRFELYALSGSKLKEYVLIRSQLIGSRSFPVEAEMRDLLRKGSSTRFVMDKVVMDGSIPDSVFSLGNLER